MRPQKRYAVLGRPIIRPVMLPTPRPAQPPPPPPARKALRRAWTVSAVAVPVIVSAIALAVSVLAYQDQHRADAAAAAASERADADLVSVSESFFSRPQTALIRNLGHTPIYGAALVARLGDLKNRLVFLSIDIVAPCSNTKVRLTTELKGGMETLGGHFHTTATDDVEVFSLQFTDANGITWNRTTRGNLQKAAPGSARAHPAMYAPSTTTSNGCS